MDRQYIDDNDLIERYVLGQLSNDEREAFEDYFALDDELIEEINAAEALMLGLREIAREPAPAAPVKSGVTTANDGSRRKQIWRVAGLALAAVSLALLTQNARLRDQLAARSAQVAPRAIQLQVPSVPDVDTPRHAHQSGWNILLMPRGNASGGEYRLRLLSADGEHVLESASFVPDPISPWIEWLVPGDTLPPGRYEVELSRVDGRVDQALSFEICAAGEADCPTDER